jgi:hypothetical protein
MRERCIFREICSMRTIFVSLLCFAASLGLSQPQERGPHNGFVSTAGEYKMEALGCDEYLEVYLYDKWMSPLLNYGIAGEVQFLRKDGSGTSEKLVLYGNDGFTAKFPEYDFTTFKVTLAVKGVYISARFRNECVASTSN